MCQRRMMWRSWLLCPLIIRAFDVARARRAAVFPAIFETENTRNAGAIDGTTAAPNRHDLAENDFCENDLDRNTDASPWIGFAAGADDFCAVHLLRVNRNRRALQRGEDGGGDLTGRRVISKSVRLRVFAERINTGG